jgi:hypothetical protein
MVGNAGTALAPSQLANVGLGAMTKRTGMLAQVQQLAHGGMIPNMASQFQGGVPNQGGAPQELRDSDRHRLQRFHV